MWCQVAEANNSEQALKQENSRLGEQVKVQEEKLRDIQAAYKVACSEGYRRGRTWSLPRTDPKAELSSVAGQRHGLPDKLQVQPRRTGKSKGERQEWTVGQSGLLGHLPDVAAETADRLQGRGVLWIIPVVPGSGRVRQKKSCWLHILLANSLLRLLIKAELWFDPKDLQTTKETVKVCAWVLSSLHLMKEQRSESLCFQVNLLDYNLV
eukprot:g36866.t1